MNEWQIKFVALGSRNDYSLSMGDTERRERERRRELLQSIPKKIIGSERRKIVLSVVRVVWEAEAGRETGSSFS
jgi:hypothetical protein